MIKYITTIIIIVLASCVRSNEAVDQHDNESADHSDEMIQATLFTDKFEYFIEYNPLEIGEESEFLVHVTNLESYKPFTRGSLTLNLGSNKVSVDQPERPGIFHIELSPAELDDHHIDFILNSEGIMDSVSMEVEIEEEGHHHETAQEKGEIDYLKEQAWRSDFMVMKLKPEAFSAVVSASGQILAVPGEKKHLTAKSQGILLFLEKNLVQGSFVEQGQSLFVITSEILGEDNFEQQYKELKNVLVQSRSEYERHSSLFKEKVISQRQFIESRTKFRNDSIRYYTMASRLSEKGLKVNSPISGYIHELNFSEGQFVELGDQLVSISNNKKLLLKADVSMKHYPLVEKIVSANFRTAYSERVYNIDDLDGKLLAKGSSVAENDHYIPVYFEVNNDGTLLEGAFVEFYLKTGTSENAIIVPLNALVEEQGAFYTYMQVGGESYTKRAVQIGDNDGEYVEIIDGLIGGERIVTKGAMLVKAASIVQGSASHEHNH